MIRLLFYVNNSRTSPRISLTFLPEGLAAILAIHLTGQPFNHVHDRAFVTHIDEAAANTDQGLHHGAVIAPVQASPRRVCLRERSRL